MRIFMAGASGVIGRRLVPLLVEAGHEVLGLTRSVENVTLLRSLGARPAVGDVFDGAAMIRLLTDFAPEAVIDQLTDLPDDRAAIGGFGSGNARMRREGTHNLLAAAAAAGSSRLVVQSVAWALPGDGGAAVAEHERATLDAGGVVVRYGQFYGPGTYYEGDPPEPPRIHIDDAARRTMPALDMAPGILVLTDDGGPLETVTGT